MSQRRRLVDLTFSAAADICIYIQTQITPEGMLEKRQTINIKERHCAGTDTHGMCKHSAVPLLTQTQVTKSHTHFQLDKKQAVAHAAARLMTL